MKILQTFHANGRTFVIREGAGRFPFEVSELTDGLNVEPSSYRLFTLAERELAIRISWSQVGFCSKDAIESHFRAKHAGQFCEPLSLAAESRLEHSSQPSCMPER